MTTKWTSTAGPRQTKDVDKAIGAHRWRGKTRIELTDHGQHEVTGFCDEPSQESQAAADMIGERFNWTITRDNHQEVLAAFESATAAIVLPVDDLRTTADERAARDTERREREATRQTEATSKATAVAIAVTELREHCPWAIPDDGKLSGHARAAKNLRKELSIVFPGVKFSVTSESFSMGNAVDARWGGVVI